MDEPVKAYRVDLGLAPYEAVWRLQKGLAAAKACTPLPEVVLLVEHHSVFTLGRRGRRENLLVEESRLRERQLRVVRVERGGDITWHGPGQLVLYPLLDVRRRGWGIKELVHRLEQALISCLKDFGIQARRIPDQVGIWVQGHKIASIGMAVKGGISFHGLALDVYPDLSFFQMIVPCGLKGVSMTSMERCLGRRPAMAQVKDSLVRAVARKMDLQMEDLETGDLALVYGVTFSEGHRPGLDPALFSGGELAADDPI